MVFLLLFYDMNCFSQILQRKTEKVCHKFALCPLNSVTSEQNEVEKTALRSPLVNEESYGAVC